MTEVERKDRSVEKREVKEWMDYLQTANIPFLLNTNCVT